MNDLCPLCELLKTEKDKILHDSKYFVIVPTKDMKGHKKRVMTVFKHHASSIPRDIEKLLIKAFVKWCEEYFDEEPTFALVDSTYASIVGHWHRIACDWYGTPEEIKQLHYTPHKAIKTRVSWKP